MSGTNAQIFSHHDTLQRDIKLSFLALLPITDLISISKTNRAYHAICKPELNKRLEKSFPHLKNKLADTKRYDFSNILENEHKRLAEFYIRNLDLEALENDFLFINSIHGDLNKISQALSASARKKCLIISAAQGHESAHQYLDRFELKKAFIYSVELGNLHAVISFLKSDSRFLTISVIKSAYNLATKCRNDEIVYELEKKLDALQKKSVQPARKVVHLRTLSENERASMTLRARRYWIESRMDPTNEPVEEFYSVRAEDVPKMFISKIPWFFVYLTFPLLCVTISGLGWPLHLTVFSLALMFPVLSALMGLITGIGAIAYYQYCNRYYAISYSDRDRSVLNHLLRYPWASQLFYEGLTSGIYIITLPFTYFAKRYQQYVENNSYIMFKEEPDKWRKENKEPYKLGYHAQKNWLPYLKSYVMPSAYRRYGAFCLGVNDSLNQRPAKTNYLIIG